MVRRNFKFFGVNEIPPYNQYIIGSHIPNNGGYIRNRTWHWTHYPFIRRAEPDGYIRQHTIETFENTTINDFLRRYDYYEVYIFMITKQYDTSAVTFCAPASGDGTDIRNTIDFNNDIVKIQAILI